MAGNYNLGNPGKALSDIGEKVSTGLQKQLNETAKAAAIKDNFENIYTTMRGGSVLQNWYQALPYGFKFSPRKGDPIIMFLPISPSNLTITTHYATNVISTLYGTVEEHSEQRYFDIVIEGTTGIAPRYSDITAVENDSLARLQSNGRKSFSAVETIPSGILGGFFSKTINTANQALNRAADTLAPQKNQSGLNIQKTGYAAFHNLYKFFLYYKKDVSGELDTTPRTKGKGHPLIFFNYKDNNKYHCAIQRFVLRRSADNPMLYMYSIQLRAYKIQNLDDKDIPQFDLKQRRAELGLDGVENSSIFSTIKNISKGAKDTIGAAVGGARIFGS